MSFCPNCGTENNGGKFCCNCGTPLPVEQPVQPAQPEVAPQPAAEPVQPQVIEQPVQPVAQPEVQPVAQPVSAPAPAPQPVMKPVAAPDADAQKTNGMCKVGFILSLVGIVTAGITSLFGLIFSIVGIIGASKKKEKGKGMAIAGIIISAVILLCVGLFFSLIANEFNEAFNELGISTVDIDDDDDDDDDDNDDSSDYVEFIESKNWIETHADSYIVFERKNNFKYYETYADTTNNYFSGKYELYTGSKAIEVITEDYEEAGLTKDEIEDLLSINGVHITGVLGDQPAALLGQNAINKGDSKTTYGTGSFTLMNLGTEPVFSKNGLLTSCAWSIKGVTNYALEGSIFQAGSVISWLKDELQFINNRPSATISAIRSKMPAESILFLHLRDWELLTGSLMREAS